MSTPFASEMFADVPIDLAVIATGGDGALQRRFGGIPFSVMNTAGSTWQARKKWWIGQGICSEVGRSAKTYNNADYAPQAAAAPSESDGTSIFDPVLTEKGDARKATANIESLAS